MNVKYVMVIVGGIVLVALAILGVLYGKRSSIKPLSPVDEAQARETAERHALLESGNKLAAEGKFLEALTKYRELHARAPDSPAARDAIQRTEVLAAAQGEKEKVVKEIEAHLVEARAAAQVPDDAKIIVETSAALALDAENAEAKALKTAATERLSKKSAEEQRKAREELAKKRKAMPTPRPQVVAAARPTEPPTPPTPTPATATLRFSFQSPIGEGTVMIGYEDKIATRKNFNFGKKSAGGLVEGSAVIPSGPHALKVWVLPTDGSKPRFKEFQATLPGGQSRTLVLTIDAQSLAVSVR